MFRKSFRDSGQQALLERDGYVVVPLLAPAEIQALQTAYHSLSGALGRGFHATMFSRSIDYRRSVSEAVSAVIAPAASRILLNFKPLTGQYAVKEPGPASQLDLHLDWSFVDEKIAPSLSFWCPLQDVDEVNGHLWVLKGSHLMDFTYRGFGYMQSSRPFAELAESPFERVAISAKAGTAVIYDHRLIHGSPPNLSLNTRIVAAQVMIPEEARSLYYHQSAQRELTVYGSDTEFYNRFMFGTVPEGLPNLGTVEIAPNFLSAANLRQLCAKA